MFRWTNCLTMSMVPSRVLQNIKNLTDNNPTADSTFVNRLIEFSIPFLVDQIVLLHTRSVYLIDIISPDIITVIPVIIFKFFTFYFFFYFLYSSYYSKFQSFSSSEWIYIKNYNITIQKFKSLYQYTMNFSNNNSISQ